jgi:hypothetical protein
MVEGAKFDIASQMAGNLHITHSYSWGSSTNPASYLFGAAYMTPKVILLRNSIIQKKIQLGPNAWTN